MEWWAPLRPPPGSGQGPGHARVFWWAKETEEAERPQRVVSDVGEDEQTGQEWGGGDSTPDVGDRPGWQGVSHSGHPARRERCAPWDGLFLLPGEGQDSRGLVLPVHCVSGCV